MNSDTIKLLSECSSGIEMGAASIDEVLSFVKDNNLKSILVKSKNEHEKLGTETNSMLVDFDENPKEPSSAAKSMSWMKTNVKLAFNGSDSAAADLITDGCNMGVKSLYKYINEYKTADQSAVDIASKLINLEQHLADQMHQFL